MSNVYIITIDGVDRTRCILWNTVTITDSTGHGTSKLTCGFFDVDGVGNPSNDQEITITLNGERMFGGLIISHEPQRLGTGSVRFQIEAVDYTRELDRRLVVESYENMTDKEIIEDIIDRYTQGSGITHTGVDEGVEVKQITFNYVPVSECISQIAKLTHRSWYIDYFKNVHYFALDATPAPFNIDENSSNFSNLKIKKSNSSIKNRVYVRGGSSLSDFTTRDFVADGEQTVWNLPDKPHDISMTVDGVTKTIGIKNVNEPAEFDYLLNYQEKYIELGADTKPANGDIMSFNYKYQIPVLVAVEDTDSIEEVGVFEFPIFDNNITTIGQARDRATAELLDYANTIVDGSFTTYEVGFRAGQFISINHPDYDINDDYLITEVRAKGLGGGEYVYDIKLVSNTTMGILQFLIRLLEQGKDLLDITAEEVVDELFSIPDEDVVITDETPTFTTHSPTFTYGSAVYGFSQYS